MTATKETQASSSDLVISVSKLMESLNNRVIGAIANVPFGTQSEKLLTKILKH